MNSKVKAMLSFSAFFIFLGSCSKTDPEIINLNGGRIGVIGHGGNGFQSERNQLPHNSFSSIIKAVEANQADGVELDVQISRDGELILYHDRTLQSMTDCSGCIINNTTDVILKCKYKNDFYTNVFENETVIKLETILERFSKRKLKPLLFLDIKLFNNCSKSFYMEREIFTKTLNSIIDKYNASKWVFVQSTDTDFLDSLKQLNKDLSLIIEGGNAEETIEIAKIKRYYGIISSNNSIFSENVKKGHSAGLKVVIFDVKTREGSIEAINKYPDFIQTDNIPLLQQCLKK